MRTTLDIDEDVLTGQAGGVVRAGATGTVAGFRPFGEGCRIVSNDQVNALREQEGI